MTGYTSQQTNDDLVNWLSAHFQGRYEPQFGLTNALSLPLGMAQLRGFWPMSSVDENGDVYDISGQGRKLTNNNSVTFGVEELATYAEFDGINQYLNRGDEAGLDITGALTVSGWIYTEEVSNSMNLVSKTGNSGNFGYLVHLDLFGQIYLVISSDGTAVVSAFNNVKVDEKWSFFACRFTPSTEIAVFTGTTINNLFKEVNTTSIPATIFNSSADFMIGWANSATYTGYYEGKVQHIGLYADALSDAAIFALFHQTRPLFNV